MLWIAGASSLAYMLATSSGVWPAIHALSLAAFFIVGYQWRLTWLWHLLATVLLANIAIATLMENNYGLAGNPNYFGVMMAIALAGILGHNIVPWFYGPALGFGIWSTQSRTAFLGLAAACFIGLWRRFPATAWCLALLAVLGAILVQKGDGSIWQRVGIWQTTLNNMTIFGHGWGSFQEAFAAIPVKINITGLTASAAYNDPIQLIFELGIGVIPLIVLFAICTEGSDEGAWTVLAAYAAMSLTYFPLWVPIAGQFTFLALGQLAASRLERKPQWHVGDLPKVIT